VGERAVSILKSTNLLPRNYGIRKRQNRTVAFIILGGLALVALMGLWWVSLGNSVSEEKRLLADVQAQNAQLAAEAADLQQYAQLQTEALAKAGALQSVMTGDVYWPTVLTEVSALIPDDVWLDSMSASAGLTEGATPTGTESAEVRIGDGSPAGRIQFTGQALDMNSVADWLDRIESGKPFEAAWLNRATGNAVQAGAGQATYQFDSTVELSSEALSQRFQQVP
jgi:Tfp pilus assembly protein PilN